MVAGAHLNLAFINLPIDQDIKKRELESRQGDPAWALVPFAGGRHCQARPRTGLFGLPSYEGVWPSATG